ncbi:MAG: hypothetical protein KUL88_09920 [Rhizobium sp.]|nr:hypothetical protein [Rhizobium sp.]
MALFRLWRTVFIPELVDEVEAAGGRVTLAAVARHHQQLAARLDRRDRNNIVGTLPVLDRDVVRDSALDRLLRDERAPGFHLEIDQHRFS